MTQLTQQTFLNSSIRNFTTSLGWKGEISKLTVALADDPDNGDSFSPPDPGAPCFFIYDSFVFGGLLQSYKTINEPGGYPTYEVILIDPRELLDGVQLILDGYNGDTTIIPNLYNVYAFWENNSYGSSLVNDGGMPWSKVIQGFESLSLLYPIQFKNYVFRVDLSAISGFPLLPEYYRLGGGFSISLMDALTQICEDAGYDFFFRLETVQGFNYIVLVIASRITQPFLGNISTFIANNTDNQAVTSEYGAELRNEVTSKFIVGGQIARIYLQAPANGSEDTYIDDTIMPFWGVNENGTPILGMPTSENAPSAGDYYFEVPSRFVNVAGVGATYPTNVMEMRAALGGQSGWETYLWSQNGDNASPHKDKAERIGIISNLRQDIKKVLSDEYTSEEKFRNLDLRTLSPLTGKIMKKHGDFIENREENVKILFDYISNYAQEFYGKKFMVRIPFTYAAIEPDTNIIRTSLEPCEGGYLSNSEIANAINNGYLPSQIFNLTKEDGRIETYCKFNNAQTLDLSEISPDDIAIDVKQVGATTNVVAYIKCTVDPKIYYLNNSTLFSPRVVVTLPGRIVPKETDGNDFAGILRVILTEHGESLALSEATINEIITNIFNRFGGEQLLYGLAGLAVTPDLIGVALQSNIETYGPWYSLGAIGKIESKQELTLVPWNYGGYEQMDFVGWSMVEEGITFQQVGETGSIEVPGSPTINLGDQLLSGGPYVTNITVAVGENGVTTTYRMETWTPRFGRLARANIDRMNRLNNAMQTQKRLMQKMAAVPVPSSKSYKNRQNALLTKTERRTPHTSATYLAGEVLTTPSGKKSANVVLSPTYDLPLSINSDNYSNKAFTSLDGLFRPFSTLTTASGISHYETPTTSGSTTRSVVELNPYQNGTDIFSYAKNNTLPGDNEHLNSLGANNNARAISLRGPLVVTGWGYDTTGKPVPNSNENSPGNSFVSDYLNKTDLWKTGPVDLKWDRDRKVWATGGGGAFRVAKLNQDLVGGRYASGVLLTPTINSTTNLITSWSEESGAIRVYDGFEFSYPATPSGARIYVQKEESSNQWFLFAAGIY